MKKFCYFPGKVCLGTLCLTLFLLAGCAAATSPEESASVPSSAPSAEETPEPIQSTDPVEKLLASMTTEEKVGQIFFVRCPEENAADDVSAYHPGGVLLFGRDFKGKTYGAVRMQTDALQHAAAIPLLIGTDEEGGSVVRASSNSYLRAEKFPAPRTLYENGGVDALCADAAEKSSFLLGLGVNVNFAPVCDIAADSSDYIYPRTIGTDAETTAQAVAAVTETMKHAGIGSVLKHFPGYGNNVNTHDGISVDKRPMSSFEDCDFLPFSAAIQSGADAVLVSHNIVACMDDSLPASLSPEVHALLRDELHFDGVIMTDDLSMDALQQYTEDGSAAVLAVLAGNDMLVATDYTVQIPQVLSAVKDGTISTARLDDAVFHVLKWKQRLGLIEAQTA